MVLALMRVLLSTPDFPPARGGIQLLLHRLVEHLPRHEVHVVTLDDHDSAQIDDALPASVRRVSRGHHHRLDVSRLNAELLAYGTRLRPDAIISGHIVTGPAALLLRRIRNAPVVQY